MPPLAVALACVFSASDLAAASLVVPNPSFETPVTTFVNTRINSWQKTPRPDWYVEVGGYFWDQLTGTFRNTPAGSLDHIVNCHGDQAAWLFAVPEVGFFQDYDSIAWNESAPSRAFDVTFTPGHGYRLTVAVIGGGGAMQSGVTLELELYYRDDASNQVVVAATTITNSPLIFSNTTHFLDFTVRTAPVLPTDPWAGRKLGIRLLSTVSHALQGGYWDVDHIRLAATTPPVLSQPVIHGDRLEFTVSSEPGSSVEILAAPDANLSSAAWTRVGVITNSPGEAVYSEPLSAQPGRFYRARELP